MAGLADEAAAYLRASGGGAQEYMASINGHIAALGARIDAFNAELLAESIERGVSFRAIAVCVVHIHAREEEGGEQGESHPS